jgi:hypothetical protein
MMQSKNMKEVNTVTKSITSAQNDLIRFL